jgi:hypothetical protein
MDYSAHHSGLPFWDVDADVGTNAQQILIMIKRRCSVYQSTTIY